MAERIAGGTRAYALSKQQRAALDLLARSDDPTTNAVHSSGGCWWDSGAWIDYRTARALRRRGLVTTRFEAGDDCGQINLTDAGRALASGDSEASS